MAGVDLGTSFDAKMKPCSVGKRGVCQMRMARRESRSSTCRGAAGDEDAPGGAAGMSSSEVAGVLSAGEPLTTDGAGLEAGCLPAAEGDGLEAGVEQASSAWPFLCTLLEGVSCTNDTQAHHAHGNRKK